MKKFIHTLVNDYIKQVVASQLVYKGPFTFAKRANVFAKALLWSYLILDVILYY